MVYQREGFGNNSPIISKAIDEKTFRKFLAKLKALDLLQFRHEYENPNVLDGHEWHYTQYGSNMKAFSSYGYAVNFDVWNKLENMLIDLLFPNEDKEERYYRRFEPNEYEHFLLITNKKKYEEYMKSKQET